MTTKKICDCYYVVKESQPVFSISGTILGHVNKEVGHCSGTKECNRCWCGGNKKKCDFYDYIREKAIKEEIKGQNKKDLEFYKSAFEEFCKNQNDLIEYLWGKEEWLIESSGNALDVNKALCERIKKLLPKYEKNKFI